MKVDAKQGGQIVNSEGLHGQGRLGQAVAVGRLPRAGRRPDGGHRHPQPPEQLPLSRPTGTCGPTGCLPPTRLASADFTGKKEDNGAVHAAEGAVDRVALPGAVPQGGREGRRGWPRPLRPTQRKEDRQVWLRLPARSGRVFAASPQVPQNAGFRAEGRPANLPIAFFCRHSPHFILPARRRYSSQSLRAHPLEEAPQHGHQLPSNSQHG